MSDLTSLKNIGERSAGWLVAVGIETTVDLERIGPVDSWRRVKRVLPDEATIVLLYALQGALLDLPWTELPDEIKGRLVTAAHWLKQGGEAAAKDAAGATDR